MFVREERFTKRSFIYILTTLLAGLMLLALVPMAWADTGKVTSSVVNVRSGPGTSHGIVGNLLNDTEVDILESSNGWYKIRFGQLQGWVAESLLDVTRKSVKVTGELVNLRSGPGTSYSNVGQVKKGEILTLLDVEGDWYKIQTAGGTTAYIAAFLTQSAQAASTPAPQPSAPVPAVIKKVQVVNGPINVRSGPGTNYAKVTTIEDKGIYNVTGQEGEWYKLLLPDGRSAYVAAWLVSEVKEETTPAYQPSKPVSGPAAGGTTGAPAVYLDSRLLTFEVAPIIENGRTLVPLRAIFEAMGANVEWDQATRTVTARRGNTTVVLPIGSTQPTVNGKEWPLDVPARIVNDRTLAPLRFVGEAYGGKVVWNEAARTINITSVVIPPDTGNKKPPAISIAGTPVNLRSGPSTSYEAVDQASPGEKLAVLDSRDGWYQVSRGGRTGWVASWVVDVAWEENEPIPEPNIPELPEEEPTPPPRPDLPDPDKIRLSRVKDEAGIKLIIESGAVLDARMKETSTGLTYEFRDRQIEGLNYIKESIGSQELKMKGLNQNGDAIVRIDIPSGVKYTTASEKGGKTEVIMIPNAILSVDSRPFGSVGERIVIGTMTAAEYNKTRDGDTVTIEMPGVQIGKVKSEYRISSKIVSRLLIEEMDKPEPGVRLIIKGKDLDRYSVGHGGDGALHIMLASKSQSKPRNENLIVIDPGHGGSETGCIGRDSGLHEKFPNLDIALEVGRILKQKGYEVEFTRTDNSYVALEERSKIANRLNAALFVSIHNNANTLRDKMGTTTYYYAPVDNPDLFLQKDEREALARSVHTQLVQKLRRQDRGVQQGNYSVLRNTEMPSILVEVVFLSNPTEEVLLHNNDFKKLAAEAIAQGIIDYMKK